MTILSWIIFENIFIMILWSTTFLKIKLPNLNLNLVTQYTTVLKN